MVALLIGYVLMALSALFKLNPHRPKIDWAAAICDLPYLIGMGVISYFGTSAPVPGGIIGGIGIFKHVLDGGNDDLGLVGGLVVSAAWSLIIYYAAISRRLENIASRSQRRRRHPAAGRGVTPTKRDRMRNRHQVATAPPSTMFSTPAMSRRRALTPGPCPSARFSA